VKIHPTTFEYEHLPAVMGLLDSVAFFWFVVLFTMVLLIWLIAKLWSLHSIPKVLAREKGYTQGRLVFWLTMLGMIWKPLWVLAVLAVVVDWDALANWLRRLRLPPDDRALSDAPEQTAAEPATVPVDPTSNGDKA